jgi:hypothetical protein
MMRVTAENRVREWRATVAMCPNSMRKQVLNAIAGPFGVIVRQGMLNLPEYC